MIDPFLRRKKQQFMKEDPSYIGGIDKDIKKLVDKINSSDDYYTTSSCSGRIMLIKEKEQKEPGLFVWVKHDKVDFEEIKSEIEKASKNKNSEKVNSFSDSPKPQSLQGFRDDLIYFKQEACLVVVACRTLENAQALLDKAQFAGWKNSGIIATKKRIILQLISTERMDIPVINKGKILIDDEALKIVIAEANSKLGRTREKISKFFNNL